MFECTLCSYFAYTRPNLIEHTKKKHNVTDFIQCPRCPKQFKTNNQISDHLRIVHPKYKYLCPYCHYTSASKSAVHKHVISMHTHTELQPYRCAYCTYTHIHAGSVHAHCKIKHKDQQPRSVQTCPLPKCPQPIRKVFLNDESNHTEKIFLSSESASSPQKLIMEEISSEDHSREGGSV